MQQPRTDQDQNVGNDVYFFNQENFPELSTIFLSFSPHNPLTNKMLMAI